MKLTLRFIALVVALLLAVAASVTAGYLALTRLDSALDEIVRQDVERLLAVTHSRRLFRSMVVLEGDYILATSPSEREKKDGKFESLERELEQELSKYQALMPAQDAEALTAIRGAKQRFIELSRQVRRAALTSQLEATKLAKLHSQDAVPWEPALARLRKLSEERLAEKTRATHVVYRRAVATLFGVSAVAALLALGLGYVIFVGIRRAMADVLALNTNLEQIVKARTAELTARERSLRLVLDSTGDGLIDVDRSGALAGACSAVATRWFGTPGPGTSIFEFLFPEDEDTEKRLEFQAGFEQLAEDLMPWEMSVDQMPTRLVRRGELFDLEYRQVFEDSVYCRILVLARDVTAKVRSEQSERDSREQQTMLAKLLEDKAGFAQFIQDCERLLTELETEQDLETSRRHLHTLKGNAACFGMDSVAARCHAIEDRSSVMQSLPEASEIAALAALFRERLQSIEAFLVEMNGDVLALAPSEYGRLVEGLIRRQDYIEILDMVELWTWLRSSECLSRLRAQTEGVAARLGKSVVIRCEHDEVRLPPRYLSDFWPTLVHIVRNAVDHGAESEEERKLQGKTGPTCIRLAIRATEESVTIEVGDDGKGIDRAELLSVARSRGLSLSDSPTLEELVFRDGLSSRLGVTDTSGRGVGVGATRQACVKAGGRVEVSSELGKGTTFKFTFARPTSKPGTLAARLEPISSAVYSRQGLS